MGNALQVGRTSNVTDVLDADYAARNDRWLTPLPIIHALGEFDLDPAGAPGHPTAQEVWTPEAVGDGLSMPWTGRVWLNPPYGRTMVDWLKALADHGQGTALIFARTDTAMFHDQVWDRATALLFLKGRLTFAQADGGKPIANSGAPSVLVAYGESDALALELADLPGHFVRLSVDSGGTNE